jgi:hypothetical protein
MSPRQFTRGVITFVALIGFSDTRPAVSPLVVVVAQSPSIVGHVIDRGGQPVPGVFITAMDATTGVSRNATSGGDGGYRFDTLPDGTYRVDFELPGFDLFRWNDVHVRGGATAMADAMLSVSAICECVISARGPLRERAGQVVDDSGRPLPYARLEIASPADREVAFADREGRFWVRVPIDRTWSLTASDSGFSAVTQEVSGAVEAPVVFTLPHVGVTGLPHSERFTRGCRCLFVHSGQ